MMEESVDIIEEINSEPENITVCPYCNKSFTQYEEKAKMVKMFYSTECYHSFHVPCFKNYVKSRLVTLKVNKNLLDEKVSFEDVCCMRC